MLSTLSPWRQDMVVLVISWKMKAREMCIYTRDEWREGMSTMGVSTVRQLRQKVGVMVQLAVA